MEVVWTPHRDLGRGPASKDRQQGALDVGLSPKGSISKTRRRQQAFFSAQVYCECGSLYQSERERESQRESAREREEAADSAGAGRTWHSR